MLEHAGAESSADAALRRESPAFGDPPIDLVHLSRQCQGDPGLEEELLGLFRALAGSLAAQISDPRTGLELKAGAAHKLRGAALAVGARQVANAAGAIEDMARAAGGGGGPRVSLAIAALQATVTAAIAQIDRLRG
ncbi:MAG TPA: Hpt domain-containing protein [Roseiarcus sp.]|nr:Hpt domain-containing protein [Roseiarcus sp.]